MADVKWIKIVTDIFDDEKILLIESMPEADGIIVIWFKLLCMAGKQNNNGVFMLNDKIAYTDEMLATVFRRPINTVRLALRTFAEFGMIEIVDDVITIPNWNKHQSLDKLEMSKEKNRKRVAAYRERQKMLVASACNDYSNDDVTNCTPTEKKESKNKNENREYIEYIVEYLNKNAGTNYRSNAAATMRHINARLSEGFTVDDFETVIQKKCAEWRDTDMEKYIRPETLFGSKFESYLNAKTTASKKRIGANGIALSNNDSSDLDGVF